ncbi:MAG: molybdopterin molybdotransferase MoeA [Syntrophomonadaceae bacterium]|nr:molybdopterin molybdotransferase MoeA [Syntrophomonadaceae bacterium]
MAEFLKVMDYRTALQKLQAVTRARPTEIIPLIDSYNRMVAQEITSPEDLPSFSRSTVDGFALFCEDTFGSSESLPAYLELIGEVRMGFEPDFEVKRGQCCWIPTGGMLPSGANAVVMVEYTEMLEQTVLVYRPVSPWENIMQKGEDIKTGSSLFRPGSLLRPQDIGLLASLGVVEIEVYKPYNIGILSTGNEVVPIQQKPIAGQIRDVNTYSIASAVGMCGNRAVTYPIIADNYAELKEAVAKALNDNELVLISGGSSVGVMDITLDVLMSFTDSEMLFHGISVKPGEPTLAVKIGEKLVIGLPGHPVSALMVFYILCLPLLGPISGTSLEAVSSLNIASQAGRDDFIPVKLVEEQGNRFAQPILGKSGLMSIMSFADGYIHINYEKQGILAGEKVIVYLF